MLLLIYLIYEKIRKYLSTESTIALMKSLVLCNSLLINSKDKLYYRLNRVIKSYIRIHFNSKRCDKISITNKLVELNYFLSNNICIFKILSITHKTIIMRKPKYINNLSYSKLFY